MSLPYSLCPGHLAVPPQGLCTGCLLHLQGLFSFIATGLAPYHSGLGLDCHLFREAFSPRGAVYRRPYFNSRSQTSHFCIFFLIDLFLITTACEFPKSRLLYLSLSLLYLPRSEQRPEHGRNFNDFLKKEGRKKIFFKLYKHRVTGRARVWWAVSRSHGPLSPLNGGGGATGSLGATPGHPE